MPRWNIICPRCSGEGFVGPQTCSMCDGRKVVPQTRCPATAAERLVYVEEAFRAYAMFKNYQVLPIAGGLYDQTAFFLAVVTFCDSISQKYKEMEEAKAEKLKDMAGKAKSGMAIHGERKKGVN